MSLLNSWFASLDSSRDLQHSCSKSFVNKLHLVLQISKILSQKSFALHQGTKHGLWFLSCVMHGVQPAPYSLLEWVFWENFPCQAATSIPTGTSWNRVLVVSLVFALIYPVYTVRLQVWICGPVWFYRSSALLWHLFSSNAQFSWKTAVDCNKMLFRGKQKGDDHVLKLFRYGWPVDHWIVFFPIEDNSNC